MDVTSEATNVAVCFLCVLLLRDQQPFFDNKHYCIAYWISCFYCSKTVHIAFCDV